MGHRLIFMADFNCDVCYQKAKELLQRTSRELHPNDDRKQLFGNWKGGSDYAPEFARDLMDLKDLCHDVEFVLKTENGDIQIARIEANGDGYGKYFDLVCFDSVESKL